MTSEEFVKSKHPNAWVERLKTRGWKSETYFIVWSHFRTGEKARLGEGDTKSKAWVDAKNWIREQNES